MAEKIVEIAEAGGRLAELVELVSAGAKVVLTVDSVPRAQLVPVENGTCPPRRIAGLHPGTIWTSDDFDAPLPDEFWTGAT